MSHPSTWLRWKTVSVGGRPVAYGQAGRGRTVLFLHGWGLDHRAYKGALARLVGAGMHVVAPALPGFGGTAKLPDERSSIPGFADWAVELLDALGIEEPVLAMGHSFGGGVAIALAHDHPDRVRGLVLVNSIGASAWARRGSALRSMTDRPLWDWGIHLSDDLWPLRQARRVLPVVVSEAAANLVRDPRSFVQVMRLAQRADLTAELEELKRRRLPVAVLWGSRDKLVTRHAFEEMCRLLGDPAALTVEGSHAWMIADPSTFGEVMSNVVGLIDGLETDLEPPVPRARRRTGRAGRRSA